MTTTLVLGGQRSGKSAYAESLLADAPAKVYLATAEAYDDEMAARIEAHRDRRDGSWTTVDAPLALAQALAATDQPVLVDCLTLWLSNVLGARLDPAEEADILSAHLATRPADAILVSGEVGLGIIPDNALARAYADALGLLNQRMAAVCDKVVLVTAGLPHILKDETKNS